jgi:hypothetical protein
MAAVKVRGGTLAVVSGVPSREVMTIPSESQSSPHGA